MDAVLTQTQKAVLLKAWRAWTPTARCGLVLTDPMEQAAARSLISLGLLVGDGQRVGITYDGDLLAEVLEPEDEAKGEGV